MLLTPTTATLLLFSLHLAILRIGVVRGKVECNSTVPGEEGDGGVCTGDYCFNIENTIRGCVDFYRMIRDDNIACGLIPIFGDEPLRMCICTQPYCGKYNAENMPELTLAHNVNCTEEARHGPHRPADYCSPGPCYVGTELVKNTAGYYTKQTCWRDWFGMIPFKGPIVYEVPPLANHSACFYGDAGSKYACLCKDAGCNEDVDKRPASPADDDEYFVCHKAQCVIGSDKSATTTECDESYLGNETCVGQMCYYSNVRYDFKFHGDLLNASMIVRDCLNYSYANPIEDLTFMTRMQFGSKSQSVFTPCRGDYCNSNGAISGGGTGMTTQISNLPVLMTTITSLLLLLTLG